jgi:hypothetical protein
MVHDFPLSIDFLNQITEPGWHFSLVQVESVNSAPHNAIIAHWLRDFLVPLDRSNTVDFSQKAHKVVFDVVLVFSEFVAQSWPKSSAGVVGVVSENSFSVLGFDALAPGFEY